MRRLLASFPVFPAGAALLLVLGVGCGEHGAGRGETGRGRPAHGSDGTADAAVAESVATALRDDLDGRFRGPVTLDFAAFADPQSGDSLRGQVIRISVPYDMVAEDTLPHDWLRERLGASGWMLGQGADGPDGSSYRAERGSLRLYLQATWEDLHLPAEVPDWYAVTIGIPGAEPSSTSASP